MKKTIFATVLVVLGTSGAFAAEVTPSSPLKDRSIGYVLNLFNWAVYATKEMTECPQGLNDGPRQQYEIQFPKDGTTRELVDTELAREMAIWFPSLEPEQFVFREPVSKIAPGLNLDGKAGPNDFVSPEGESGIDNQFYRVLGCIEDYRPGGLMVFRSNHFMARHNYSRGVIELTDVDSLVNDDDVTVTTYRGRDKMLTNATGNEFLPYGTQRVDKRWGKIFSQRTHGKITNGVLTTDPMDVYVPYNYAFEDFGAFLMRGTRLKLKLTPEQASGLWAGYVDISSWYLTLIRGAPTHSLNYGGESAQSMYKAMNKWADGFPDPKTGRNTAISGAMEVKFRQVYVQHPDAKVASEKAVPQNAAPLQKSAQNISR